jgi:hypothetical protein
MEAMSSSNVGEVVPDFTALHPEHHSNMGTSPLPALPTFDISDLFPLTTSGPVEGIKCQWQD